MSKWEPSPKDTTAYAAFRWFGNTIENESMELYATDRENFEQIEQILRDTLRELAELRRLRLARPGEDECPDGWILCNGVCAPSCDLIGAVPSQK